MTGRSTEDIRARAAAFLAADKAAGGRGVDQAALHAWLDEDPRHRVAYDRLRNLWQESEAFGEAPSIRAARREALRPAARWMRPAVLAASIVLAVLLVHSWTAPRDVLQTAVGELRTARLDDGTEVVLDTDSAVRVAFTDAERHVELLRGQALFRVTKNPQRPFTVAAAGTSVTALGTEFAVRREADAATVILLEGSVRVVQADAPTQQQPQAAVLQPGEQIHAAPTGLSARAPAKRDEDVAWQSGRLVFRDRTLEDVVAEVNRYAKRKLRIGDAQVRAMRISGVFQAGQVDTLVQALVRSYGLHVTPGSGNDLVLHAAPSKK